jgi:hypothetical protein
MLQKSRKLLLLQDMIHRILLLPMMFTANYMGVANMSVKLQNRHLLSNLKCLAVRMAYVKNTSQIAVLSLNAKPVKNVALQENVSKTKIAVKNKTKNLPTGLLKAAPQFYST